jgi:hypothetical protein
MVVGEGTFNGRKMVCEDTNHGGGWVRVVSKRMLALWWLVRAHSTRGRWFVGTQTMGETGLELWGHKSCGKGR